MQGLCHAQRQNWDHALRVGFDDSN